MSDNQPSLLTQFAARPLMRRSAERTKNTNIDPIMGITKTNTTGQPLVDETEAATAGTVTTSTVKHDVTVKIPVHEDGADTEESNLDDSPQHQSANEEPATDQSSETQSLEERKAKLNESEMKIEKGLATFVEVGQALSFININRLYLPEYKTWEEYVEIRWGFTKQRAFQYMEAANGHRKFSAMIVGNRKLPLSERAMRELMKVPDDKVVDVLDKVGGDAELTAERIVKARDEVVPKRTSSKAKKKPVIKIDAALKGVGVWTAFLAACDLGSMTEQQRKDLQKANKNAADKFSKLSITA